ncbi:ATP-dependent Clp protease proteolytic subunit [Fusobacterium necrophorum subsp. funduliforme]|uniref:head maturation protease, ClpP-related n=1 Tax=Fusobacterium necrophorum TaxID=859 RepID=UPI00164D2DBE|nr:head maturation protease, ClpP-related [Fusobacterium necrophorum]MDY2573589.1 Clp protease ClpP [Fusobacterium necrophorum]
MEYLNLIKKENNKATILMYGMIGNEWYQDVSAQEIAEDLELYLNDVTEITLRINSPGGYITAGTALYSALKQHKAKKIVMIDGICASVATIVAMAGDVIKMNPLGAFVIHNPWIMNTSGDADSLRKRAEELDKEKSKIVNAYKERTGLSEEEIIELMNQETSMTAEEALEKKFIDEIEEFKINSLVNCIDYQLLNEKKEEKVMAGNTESIIKKADLTLNFLKENFPEIYNQIREEGIKEERNRIKALDEMMNFKGAAEIVNKAKYEDIKSANEISLEILKAQNIVNSEKKLENGNKDKLQSMKKDANILNEVPGANPSETTMSYIDQIVNFANVGKEE